MKNDFYIKNMVCDRCKMVVRDIFEQNGAQATAIQLGKVSLEKLPSNFDLNNLISDLNKNGFELMESRETKLVEEIKLHLISAIDSEEKEAMENLSFFLPNKLHKDYSVLSKTFKRVEGQTIEKFFIRLKIEKVKELIQMDSLSFSEIAYQLNYNSISHLSGQFKNVVGMSMSEYKRLQNWNRSSFDKIV